MEWVTGARRFVGVVRVGKTFVDPQTHDRPECLARQTERCVIRSRAFKGKGTKHCV